MEPSKQSKEILNLGRKIVEQLGQEQSHDVLGHWLSYHLAELMKTAELAEGKSKKALEKECVELILKIWKNRANAPRALRPLTDLESAIRLLQEIGNSRDHTWSAYLFRGKDPWHKSGATIHETANLMMGLLLYTQTLETDWANLESWRESLPTMLNEEEVSLIDGIKGLAGRVQYYYGLDKLGNDKALINKAVIEKLRKELERQSKAIDELEIALAMDQSSKGSSVEGDLGTE
ncbi:hypothetical protein INP83_11455 [Mucilaginibacter sp. 21P]|uniref:hypothetical protein n=1 Tax=Mucilaginibacter sp. 21P TaxID=2778902 RepID=UPI001C58F813|nr:hypothetical protein [Mucilaginibacter sp. 21P]QXV63725.1 hypothetical protein INP83_11455 [Mucilaginibacter sp. 21P]